MDTIESPFLSLKLSDSYSEIREAVRDLCSHYPDEYWRKVDDERGFPEEFVNALTSAALFVKIVVTLLKRPSLVYYPVVVLG